MYLHIGASWVVRRDSVAAICDIDNTTASKITRDFLSGAEARGELVNAAEDIPRSFILCEERGKRRVYLSQLSPAALSRR